jgi:FkbM family methyltransferase
MSSPGSRELIRTNLGISRKLRCDIPLDKPTHLFGRPENMLAERSALLLVAELVKDCKDFVDIGANEGLFTFFIGHAAAGIGARCHWFEPDDDLRERLIRNLAANGVAAQGNGVAVSDRKGSATFHKNLSDDSSGSLTGHFTGKHSTREIIVNTVTMSDYFRDQEIGSALVKIDVEGAGCAVWAGASAVADRITYLVMEMLAPEIESELPRKIIEAGFHAYYMRDFQLVEAPRGRFEYQAPFWNWLFSRLDPQRLAERLKGTRFQVVRAG